jgi:hypothetical protein
MNLLSDLSVYVKQNLCREHKNNGEVVGFEFVSRICLHKDDRKVLEYIKYTLDCGRLNTIYWCFQFHN